MFKNIQDWAEGTNHLETIAVGNDFRPTFSRADFSQSGLGRYGFTNTNSKGSTSGERGSLEALESAIQRLDNPFQIEGNMTYVATVQDLRDAQYLLWSRTLAVSVYDFWASEGTAPIVPPVVPSVPPVQPPVTTLPSQPPVLPPEPSSVDLSTVNGKLDAIAEILKGIAAGTDTTTASSRLTDLRVTLAKIEAGSEPRHAKYTTLLKAVHEAVDV